MGASEADRRERQLDLRLGRIAVRKQLLDEARLRMALADQEAGVKRGRKKARRLGVILAEKGWLSDAQIRDLLEEQEARLLAEEARQREDRLLGRILVDAGMASAEHVDEALQTQALAIGAATGSVPLLGELLVSQGHATKEDVDQALELQKRSGLRCSACGKEASLDAERCAGCGGPLQSVEPAPEPEAALPRIGRYDVVRPIGRGGSGQVYEAVDPSLQRRVALKILRSDLERKGTRETEVRRFNREARLAAKLPKHPNIVEVYETGVDAGRHFIAMEFVEGRTLGEWRKDGPPLRRQIAVLAEVCAAVQHAHDHGVLHRDLKPRNILVGAEDRAFVLDFGIARPMADDPELSGVVCGTASYMSPEQAEGASDLDARADVYSLGAILHEVLTGRSPFEGMERKEVLKKLREGGPGPTARPRPFSSVDAEIQGICRRAMAPKREDRPGSARELGAALLEWLGRDRKPATGEASRPAGGRRLLLAGSVVGLLALAGLAWALTPSAVDRECRRGEARLAAGDLEGALASFGAVLRVDPSHGGGRAGKAEALRRRLEAAVREVEGKSAQVEQARKAAEAAQRSVQGATLKTEGELREAAARAQGRIGEIEKELQAARERLRALTEAR